MIKKILLAVVALVLVVVVGAFVAVRALLDPETVRHAIETQGSAALGEPVRVGGASFSVWPRAGVDLSNLQVGEPAAVTLEHTSVSTSMRALFNRRIEDADVIVENSVLDLPRLLKVLDALGREPAAAPAPSAPAEGGGEGFTLVNVRTLALRNVTIAYQSRRAVFDVESSLAGDRLEVKEARITSNVSTITATGVVESLKRRKATLSLTADPLDLDGLMAFAQAFSGAPGGATPAPTAPAAARPAAPASGEADITLELKAAKGRAAGIAFETLSAKAHLTPKGLDFEPFGFGIFGGRLDGAVRLDLEGKEPALSVNGKLNGVDMAKVMEFAEQPGTITGTLGGSLSVNGSGIDPETALGRATGKGAIAIANGTMKGLQMVRTIVLAFGKPDLAPPEGAPERFTRLGGDMSLASGVVTLSNLQFLSTDVDVNGAGTLTLKGSAIKVDGKASLSKELTAQAGRDLVRFTAEEGRVTVPARVTGTVSAPKVSVDIGDMATRAAKNEVKRQADKAVKSLLDRTKKKQ
jgi:uncharacterized protein involved in outer membrane biogenesis